MPKLILVNKPYGFVCQFSPSAGRQTLADLVPVPGVYPAGRLDADSEGLLALTDDGRLQARIADPRHKLEKGYWVQVEGVAAPRQLEALRAGVDLGDFVTRPALVESIAEPPGLWPRQPPIRTRREIPATWLDVRLREGRNRQIRRMTAKAGLPTLRLIRYQIGPWTLDGLEPGQWREACARSVISGLSVLRQPHGHRPR
ncbi:MAG TPA: pseudouridine synthase [Usitatibacteraceae bacterium]|nr:pseudouridine synthase [Usitatibacteraceae bacterium]